MAMITDSDLRSLWRSFVTPFEIGMTLIVFPTCSFCRFSSWPRHRRFEWFFWEIINFFFVAISLIRHRRRNIFMITRFNEDLLLRRDYSNLSAKFVKKWTEKRNGINRSCKRSESGKIREWTDGIISEKYQEYALFADAALAPNSTPALTPMSR